MNAVQRLSQAVQRFVDNPPARTIFDAQPAPEYIAPPPEPVLPPEVAAYLTLSELNRRAPVAAMRLESRYGGGAWREWSPKRRKEAWAAASRTDYTPEPEPVRRSYVVLPIDHPAYDALKSRYKAHDATKWLRMNRGFIDWNFEDLAAFLGLVAAVARVDGYSRTPAVHGCPLLEDYRRWMGAATFDGF